MLLLRGVVFLFFCIAGCYTPFFFLYCLVFFVIVGAPQVYQSWLLGAHPSEVELVVVIAWCCIPFFFLYCRVLYSFFFCIALFFFVIVGAPQVYQS